ncbi:AAA family ATPase [Ruminococcus flavefaciens]|uniref:AAA domain-containing protein n=1 Tax=Ruminococcus flavefaciens TaxID=1265 RepID=A0A315Y560_RUMFL|nr:AAA family ATPase [Ruminococcus flavefaciens]PWJ14169.1 AAA domain-containing protein [Ruminococcus flavefaciens]SSA43898.1 AAA domain-containing protein [Ruminococcus flavefaciens]
MEAKSCIYNMAKIQETETEWLWYPYIPYGKVTIIQGDPGEGKTTLALNIAAALTKGENVTGGKTDPITGQELYPVPVLFQTAEDGLADTIKPRLVAAGADCGYISGVDESVYPLTITDGRLDEALRLTNARLIILDPLQAYLGADVDMHRANEIRPVMSYLSNMAEQFGCAIILIGHMNKNTGAKAAYRGLGSIDLTAAARSVLLVARDKRDTDRRIVMHIKSSLAREGKPVAFRLGDNNSFTYEGECEADPDSILLGMGSPQPKQTELSRQLLMAELGSGEAKSVKSLIAKAAEIGVTYDIMKKIKDELHIISERHGNTWFWKWEQ